MITDFNFTMKIFTFYILSFSYTTILCVDVSRCFFVAVVLVLYSFFLFFSFFLFSAVAVVVVVAVFRLVLVLYFSKNRLKDQASV